MTNKNKGNSVDRVEIHVAVADPEGFQGIISSSKNENFLISSQKHIQCSLFITHIDVEQNPL